MTMTTSEGENEPASPPSQGETPPIKSSLLGIGTTDVDYLVSDDEEHFDEGDESQLLANDGNVLPPLPSPTKNDDALRDLRRRNTMVSLYQYNSSQNALLADGDENTNEERTSSSTNHNKRRQTQMQSILPDSIKLATSHKHVTRAISAILFCVFVDSINLQCTAPNYPLMVTIGSHPDSFPNTEPFDFAAAQYMLYTASKLGALISNLGAGHLSDKWGRRQVLLLNLAGSVFFTFAKYIARSSYWAFVGMTFANGLFGSTAAVATGYMADVFIKDRSKADAYINHVIAIAVIGRSLGGLLTVMFPDDLFVPIIPAACLTLVGFMVAYKLVLEPHGVREALVGGNGDDKSGYLYDSVALGATKEKDEDDDGSLNKQHGDQKPPETMDKKTLFNIIFGGVMDNAGSFGILPLGFSPLMFDVFHNDFVQEGLDPIMREQTYRWLYSMMAMVVIPGALASPYCYKKFGIAMSCVMANLLTACTILALMYVALSFEPTKLTYAICASIIYLAFPFTMISQLSTGPMLDRIAPLDQKGFAQGLYGAVVDGTAAVFPLVLGLIADSSGIAVTLWICIGISIFAAIVNFPLVFNPVLQKPKDAEDGKDDGDDDDDDTVATIDEEDIQLRLENGDFVPSKHVWAVNMKRLERGDPFLYTKVGTYTPRGRRSTSYGIDNKKKKKKQSNKPTKEEYMYLRDMAQQRLLAVKENPSHAKEIADAINFHNSDSERLEMDRQQLGEWISQYLVDNGYFPGEHSPILKAMVESSFPRLSSREITPENIEPRLVRIAKLMNDYMEREGLDDSSNLLFQKFTLNRRRAPV